MLKPLPEMTKRLSLLKFFSKKLMLPTILLPEPVLDLWDSVESKMRKMSKSSVEIPEVEEEVMEAEEETEVEEVRISFYDYFYCTLYTHTHTQLR